VVVVNTGTSFRHGQQLLQAIRRVTDKPVRVALVTHTRPEFLFGAAAFQAEGIPVQMHRQAAELMRGRCERCLKKLQTLLGPDAMQGTRIFTPDHEIESAALLKDAGRVIQLLYFGHSSGPGDMAVFDVQSGVLFAGGLVENRRIPDVQDGNLAGWADALQKLRAMSATLIVPGHGAAGTLALLDAQDHYLMQLQARVAGLLQQGSTLQDIGGAATLPDFAGWDGYDTLHQRNAATVFLRLEQAAVLEP
jgi:glyoxylase-like metal-dependent hydrolase (beta-lactamase superfamily II)